MRTFPPPDKPESEMRMPEVTAEGLEDSDQDVVTGVRLEDDTALWRFTGRRFGYTEDQPFGDDSPPIEVTISQDGEEVGTTTIAGGEPGTWWQYDEATVDLSFQYSYPDDVNK